LDSAVQGVVNVLARAVAEQKGTQTEKDADRAFASVVSLQDDLLSPLKGDTQESAKARIEQTLLTLDTILSNLPNDPTPQPKPAGTTQAAPAGPTAGAGQFSVVVGGQAYSFPTQAALDLFKRAANIP
jgi:hypothetical protein